MSEHPTYDNPTIQEALCEIHFCLPAGIEWKPSLAGELFKLIQPEFPELEPVSQIGIQIELGRSGMGRQLLLPPQNRMRYKHASRNLLLQFSEGILTVNELPKYPGWRQFTQDIFDAWKKVHSVVRPESISGVGLRYINRIERTNPEQQPRDWLARSVYVPEAVLGSLPGFLSRLEFRPETYHRMVVTLGESAGQTPDAAGAIVLDIDCILEKDVESTDNADLETQLNLLHGKVWDVFSASLTPQLEQFLQGGGK